MKRDRFDADLDDLDRYCAKPFGLTVDQVLAFNFPQASYYVDGLAHWHFEAYHGWFCAYRDACYMLDRLRNPVIWAQLEREFGDQPFFPPGGGCVNS